RSLLPSAQRYSIVIVRPSIHPSSRSRWTKALTHWLWVAGAPAVRSPIVGRLPDCCSARAASGHAAAAHRDELAPFIKKTIGYDTTHRALATQSLNLSPFSFPRVDAGTGGQFIRSARRRE